MRIALTADEWAAVEAEADRRIAAYVRLGLPTNRADGPWTRLEVQTGGVAGEAAVLKALGLPVERIASTGQLDGGSDIVLATGRRVQVKTAMRLRIRFCYEPPWRPPAVEPDFMVQCGWTPGIREVLIVAWCPRRWFLDHRHPVRVGMRDYRGVEVGEMLEPGAAMVDAIRREL